MKRGLRRMKRLPAANMKQPAAAGHEASAAPTF